MQDAHRRSVGFWLGAGIFIAPYVFAWALLRRGHSWLARGVGFAWLAWFGLLGVGAFNAYPRNRPGSVSEARVPTPQGLVATSVEKDGPVERAGVRQGDIFSECGGRPVRTSEDFYQVMVIAEAGKTPVTCHVWSKSASGYSEKVVSISSRPDSGAALSLWTYDTKTDDMRGSTNSYASLKSVNELNFRFPYNRGEARGRIDLRKSAHSGVDAMLAITQGQFVCGFDGCSVSVKFDDGPIQKLWCNRPSDGDSTVLFVGDPKTFITRIKRARHILVEAEFFQEGLQQLEFMPAGLVWKD